MQSAMSIENNSNEETSKKVFSWGFWVVSNPFIRTHNGQI